MTASKFTTYYRMLLPAQEFGIGSAALVRKLVGGSLFRQEDIITKPKTANLASIAQSPAETTTKVTERLKRWSDQSYTVLCFAYK